jgi:hypothetical protein
MFMVQSVPDCAVAIHVYGSKEVYQTELLLFMFMVQSKCTRLCCEYSCLWLEGSVPDCAVAIHVYGSSKCTGTSLRRCYSGLWLKVSVPVLGGYSCLWFEVSVPDCDVVIAISLNQKILGFRMVWREQTVPVRFVFDSSKLYSIWY